MTAQPVSLFVYQILIYSIFPLIFGPLLLFFCGGTKQNRSKPTHSQYTLSAQSNSIPETASELKDIPQSTQISEGAKTDSKESPQATQPDTKNTNATSPTAQENKESPKDVPNQAQKTVIAQKEEIEAKHSPGESLGEFGSAFSETSKHYRQDPTQISENKKKAKHGAKTPPPKHANPIKSSSSNQKQIEKEHSKQRQDLTQYSEIKKKSQNSAIKGKSQNSAIKQTKSTNNTSANQKLIGKEPPKQSQQKEKSEMAENKIEKTQISAAKSIVSDKRTENKVKHPPPAKAGSKTAITQ